MGSEGGGCYMGVKIHMAAWNLEKLLARTDKFNMQSSILLYIHLHY